MRSIRRHAGVLFAAIIVGSCGESEGTTAVPPAAFAVSPSQLTVSDSNPTAKVYLTTTPAGGRLDWQVSSKPSWLAVTPAQGKLTGSILELTIDASALAQTNPGSYTEKLEFVSSGGVGSIDVLGRSLPNPRFAVAGGAVEVGETADSARFVVRHAGKGDVDVAVISRDPWLTVAIDNGYLRRGESTFVRVAANKVPLAAGTHPGRVVVRSQVARDSTTVSVTVKVAAAPQAILDVSRVAFVPGDNSERVYLRNPGKGSLTWTSSGAPTWLFITPSSGIVPANDSVLLTLNVDRARLTTPEAAASVTINSDAVGGAVTLPVIVSAAPGFAPGLTVLSHRVLDAEASASAGVIVTVSTQPSQLNILDVITGTTSSVSLARVPTSVAVRPDGAFAAVGHDGSLTLVDLRSRSVVRNYPVPADILDIVLAQNGWAYAFPIRDQWTSIQSVELSTGNVVASGGYSIYAGTYARLHPSGNAIYGSQTGLSPADHEYYDITAGPAVRKYDSRYHGDYPMGGDAWISDDGTRLFNRWAHVFRLSPNQSEDLVYGGRIAGINDVRFVADAPALGRVVALANAPVAFQTTLSSYDRQTLTLVGRVSLPQFASQGTTVASMGRFVFVIRGKVFVLVQADPNGSLLNDWGIAAEVPVP